MWEPERGSIVVGIPFASFPQSRFQPCPACGVAVECARTAAHRCDDGRLLSVAVSDESARLEAEFAAWLASPHGRFLVWLAERER